MSALTDIYDYFTPIEDAICAVFKDAGLTCFSSASEQPEADEDETAADGTQHFQKKRPRVEVTLHPGAGMGRLRVIADRTNASGHLPEQARRSQLTVDVITDATISTHRSYVAQVIAICDTLAFSVNNTRQLTHHKLQSVRSTGGNAGYRPQEGVMQTTLTFDVDFSVQTTAWEALENP